MMGQRDAVTAAHEAVQQALALFIERLPVEDGALAVVRLSRKSTGTRWPSSSSPAKRRS